MSRMMKIIRLVAAVILVLPVLLSAAARYYTVLKGDTIYGISRKTGVSVQEIQKLNNISDPKKLYVGLKLKLPGSTDEKTSVTQSPSVVFRWPASGIRHVEKDGDKGVKSIGVYITVQPGAQVNASASGIVSKIGYVRGYGNYVVMTHDSRYMTVYSNLGSIFVRSGQKLEAGRAVGRLSASSSRFHFQINQAGNPLDARKILK